MTSVDSEMFEEVAAAIDENMLCPVCKLECGTDARGLSCQHFVCLSCARALLEFSAEVNETEEERVIQCPMCRQQTLFPEGEGAETLPPAYQLQTLRDIKDMIKDKTSQGRPPPDVPLCEKCSGYAEASTHMKYAKYECEECETNYCQECMDAHNDYSGFENHTYKCLQFKCDVPCALHPKTLPMKPSTKFCMDCWSPVCSPCFMTKHEKHRTEDLSAAIVRQLDGLSELKKQVKGHMSHMEEQSEKVNVSMKDLQISMDNYCAQIDQIKEKAIQWVTQEADKFMAKIFAAFEERCETLKSSKDELGESFGQSREKLEKLTHLSEEAAPVNLLKVQTEDFAHDPEQQPDDVITELHMPRFVSTFYDGLTGLTFAHLAPSINASLEGRGRAATAHPAPPSLSPIRSILRRSLAIDNFSLAGTNRETVERDITNRDTSHRETVAFDDTSLTYNMSYDEEMYEEENGDETYDYAPRPPSPPPTRRVLPPYSPYIFHTVVNDDEEEDEEDGEYLQNTRVDSPTPMLPPPRPPRANPPPPVLSNMRSRPVPPPPDAEEVYSSDPVTNRNTDNASPGMEEEGMYSELPPDAATRNMNMYLPLPRLPVSRVTPPQRPRRVNYTPVLPSDPATSNEPVTRVHYTRHDVTKLHTIKPGRNVEVRDFKLFPGNTAAVVMTTNRREKPLMLMRAQECEGHYSVTSTSMRFQTQIIGARLLKDPWGVCVTPDGTIAVVDKQKSIEMFDLEGRHVQSLQLPSFKRLFSIASCSSTRYLATADWDEKVVRTVDPRANRVVTVFDDGSDSSGDSSVFGMMPWHPTYISAGRLGGMDTLSVVDEANMSIKLFDVGGNLIRELSCLMTGARPRGADGSWAPNCTCVDNVGGVWVADPHTNSVSRFSGRNYETWDEILRVGAMSGKNWNAIDFGQGRLAVDTTYNYSDNRIEVYQLSEDRRRRPSPNPRDLQPRRHTSNPSGRPELPVPLRRESRAESTRGRYPPPPPARNRSSSFVTNSDRIADQRNMYFNT